MTYQFKTTYKQLLADTTTPVSIYLRLRDVFPNSLLLESSDYHSRENNMSYICCEAIAGIKLDRDVLEIQYPEGKPVRKSASEIDLRKEVSQFRNAFQEVEKTDFRFISNGLFGFFTFDTVVHFEDIELKSAPDPNRDIPFLQYHVYRYVIAIDHFRNQLFIFEHQLEGDDRPSGLEKIQHLIQNKNFPEIGRASWRERE